MNVLADKSYSFALRIINLSRYLQNDKKKFILSKQVLRSGTAIGALVAESEFAQSKADFISKLHISIKEASETRYWLRLLKDSSYISEKMYNSLNPELIELLKLLTSSIKTSKENNGK